MAPGVSDPDGSPGRFVLDPAVRRTGDGRLLVGGSPRRLFRLTAAGAELIDALADRRPLGPGTSSSTLVARLLDAGALHPVPEPGAGPFDATDVTVVVPCRDRPDGLDELLSSLAAAGDRHAGVVVVDDGSLDPSATAAVAARHGARLLRRQRSGGPAAARNEGTAIVRTPLVAFIDADCFVAPGWLGPLLAQMADPTVAIAAPRVRSLPADADGSIAASLATYESSRSPLDLGSVPAPVRPGGRVSYVPSAAILCRRDAFEAVGGFDAAMRVGEDVDLVWRLVEGGDRVRYDPRSTVWHRPRPDLQSWLDQRLGYGSSAAALERRHPGAVAPAAMSRWSLAVWAPVLVGHPAIGAAVAAATTVQLGRTLGDVPSSEVARLGLGGHLGAGRQLATTTVRVWWPLALLASLTGQRARRAVAAAVAVTVVDDALSVRRAGGTPTLRTALLGLLDHTAYGAGVWRGAWRERSWRALLPAIGR